MAFHGNLSSHDTFGLYSIGQSVSIGRKYIFLSVGLVIIHHIFTGIHKQSPVVQQASEEVNLLSVLRLYYQNTLIFFVEKNERSFCTAKASHIFSIKNIGKF